MSNLALLLVLALATHRVTRLLTRDQVPVIKRPRDLVLAWIDPRDTEGHEVGRAPLGGFGRSIAYLMECDWCMSVWVAGALTWATATTVGLPLPWLVWPALSTVTGLIASRLEADEPAPAADPQSSHVWRRSG